jgi:HSP20 family protein
MEPTLLRPWRPFRELEEMERLLESPFRWWWRRLPADQMAWAPSVDMYEKEDNFMVRVELPGVKKEDIDISVTGDTLTIKGERKPPVDVKEEECQCCEVCYGSFSRAITLPAAVDAGKIEASYEDGILEIGLPKAKKAKLAKIQVKAK